MRWRASTAAALLALTGCEPATTPTLGATALETAIGPTDARAPNWAVGSLWKYSDGYGLQVVSIDGLDTKFVRLDDPSQWVVRRGFLREDARSATTVRSLVFEDLPRGAGLVLSTRHPLVYRREYNASGVTRSHVTSWTVDGRDRVRVPAGEFDCIVLTMRTRNVADGWTGYERWWFSPLTQNYVRMEYRYGDAPPGSRVLVSYQLSGPVHLSP